MIVNKASLAGEVLFTGTGAVVRKENAVTNLGSVCPPSHSHGTPTNYSKYLQFSNCSKYTVWENISTD